MRMPSTLTAILVGLAVLTAASSASVMYHPTMGRFMQRDLESGDNPAGLRIGTAVPSTAGRLMQRDADLQYADDMSLYEYSRGSPALFTDADGRSASPPLGQYETRDQGLYDYLTQSRGFTPDEADRMSRKCRDCGVVYYRVSTTYKGSAWPARGTVGC